MDLHELYWAAGFLEGEGCFQAATVKRKKYKDYYGLSIQARQVQREPLKRLQKLLGGAIYKYKHSNGGNHNDYHLWQSYGAHSAGLMMTLWTLMSPKRRQQIEIALEKWKMNPRKEVVHG